MKPIELRARGTAIVEQLTNSPRKEASYQCALDQAEAIALRDPNLVSFITDTSIGIVTHRRLGNSTETEGVLRVVQQMTVPKDIETYATIWAISLTSFAHFLVDNNVSLDDEKQTKAFYAELVDFLCSPDLSEKLNGVVDPADYEKQITHIEWSYFCYVLSYCFSARVAQKAAERIDRVQGLGYRRMIGQPLSDALRGIKKGGFRDKATLYQEALHAIMDAYRPPTLPGAPVHLLDHKIFAGDDEGRDAIIEELITAHKKRNRQRILKQRAQDAEALPKPDLQTGRPVEVEIRDHELLEGLDTKREHIIGKVAKQWLDQDPSHSIGYSKGRFHGKPPTPNMEHLEGYVICLLKETIDGQDYVRYVFAESLEVDNAAYLINMETTNALYEDSGGTALTWRELTSLKRSEVQAVGGRQIIHTAPQGIDLYEWVASKVTALMDVPAEQFKSAEFVRSQVSLRRGMAGAALKLSGIGVQ